MHSDIIIRTTLALDYSIRETGSGSRVFVRVFRRRAFLRVNGFYDVSRRHGNVSATYFRPRKTYAIHAHFVICNDTKRVRLPVTHEFKQTYFPPHPFHSGDFLNRRSTDIPNTMRTSCNRKLTWNNNFVISFQNVRTLVPSPSPPPPSPTMSLILKLF